MHPEIVSLNAKIPLPWFTCRIGRYFRKQARLRITRHHIGAYRQSAELIYISVRKRLPLAAHRLVIGRRRLPAYIIGNSGCREEIALVSCVHKYLGLNFLSCIHSCSQNPRVLFLYGYQAASEKHFDPGGLQHFEIKFLRSGRRKIPDTTDSLIKLFG